MLPDEAAGPKYAGAAARIWRREEAGGNFSTSDFLRGRARRQRSGINE